MKPFLGEDFLLSNDPARRLFHEVAKDAPIVDYHSHLPPRAIAANRSFSDIGSLWLEGDHYKWRAMRACGIDERLITGDASWREKFDAYAAAMPMMIGNPLYHWTHLELRRFFGIEEPLSANSANRIWQACNEQLAAPEFATRRLIERMTVEMIGTTDDPADDLADHRSIADDPDCSVLVRPTFRPDKVIQISARGFGAALDRLGRAADIEIRRFTDLVEALDRRIEHFAAHGCLAADHGLDVVRFARASGSSFDRLIERARSGDRLEDEEIATFETEIQRHLARRYVEKGWVMQFHCGPRRRNSSLMTAKLGPDTGFDAIDDRPMMEPLSRLLDAMDREDGLPRTILYNVDPARNVAMAAMAFSFNRDGVAGKMQFGSAWWHADHVDGMRRQMSDFASTGVIGTFIGMLTDSRSFVSFPRHELFRRVLCDLVGGWMEEGLMPPDFELAGDIVEKIAFANANALFGKGAGA
ncbi:glucuronate isomerase [Jiella sp. MQZ9-1]|uniref:Uronate isomerase n=1 Tax=Jiella flava TaxID=2816857 RepID=A0A939FWI8_9HYPH|nr:glucuronate isomerase [Jiella flava]MBO0663278.1 glucuronate isomerase [Jiella flava]MCD2471854.1 glucuronate isomerase [Jiella flava]